MPMTATKAWEALRYYRARYYDIHSAMYSGDPAKLAITGRRHTFWKRDNCNCRIHIPIAADIAATSSNLLFGIPVQLTVNSDGDGEGDSPAQKRLDYIVRRNSLQQRFTEAAETAAILGDTYAKLRWHSDADAPILEFAQPDSAWPEYRFGELACVHFFTPRVIDYQTGVYTRIYELYERGTIRMEIYRGTEGELGSKLPDSELEAYGFEPEITTPIDALLCEHIANVRPNRLFRDSMHGRSDLDDLRDLTDALDETYSSWIRDIRLAKSRLIVPADYLRRKPQAMVEGLERSGSWEFDTDVETYVAMDIDPEAAHGTGITPSQFAIRATEHAQTCAQLIEEIVTRAGYSPQSFGIDINGTAQSGTALTIRERKTAATRDKKRGYWRAPLERILTSMVRLDAALYPGAGSVKDDTVSVEFPKGAETDLNSIAQAVNLLHNAQAASLETKISMLHPDWSPETQTEEADRVRAQYATNLEAPIEDALMGDNER